MNTSAGFDLLMKVFGLAYAEARRRIVEAAGLTEYPGQPRTGDHTRLTAPSMPSVAEVARPPSRVLQMRRMTCAVEDCPEAATYLASRALWPLPSGCVLRAHPTLEYFDNGQRIGRYTALVADVTDLEGELVTTHTTYLCGGEKLATHEPRKLMSALTGRRGCAVRLVPLTGDALGICEGLETGLAASKLHNIPTWAALNASLLSKFEPPAAVQRLVIFADRDVAGLEAASRLMERLQGRCMLEIRPPPSPHKDWNNVLLAHREAPSSGNAA